MPLKKKEWKNEQKKKIFVGVARFVFGAIFSIEIKRDLMKNSDKIGFNESKKKNLSYFK